MSGLLNDVNGKSSGKRVAGYTLLAVALAAGLYGAFTGNALLVDYAKWMLTTGAASVIAGVAERKSGG